MRWLVAIVVLAGCGPSWSGRYSGHMSGFESCGGGTGNLVETNFDWSIEEDAGGKGLTIETGRICTGLGARVDDPDTAQLNEFQCPAEVAGTTTRTPAIKGGVMHLERGFVDLWQFTQVSINTGSATGACASLVAGRLTRF